MFPIQNSGYESGDRDGEKNTDAAAEGLQKFHYDKFPVQQLQQARLIGQEQQNCGKTAADVGKHESI